MLKQACNKAGGAAAGDAAEPLPAAGQEQLTLHHAKSEPPPVALITAAAGDDTGGKITPSLPQRAAGSTGRGLAALGGGAGQQLAAAGSVYLLRRKANSTSGKGHTGAALKPLAAAEAAAPQPLQRAPEPPGSSAAADRRHSLECSLIPAGSGGSSPASPRPGTPPLSVAGSGSSDKGGGAQTPAGGSPAQLSRTSSYMQAIQQQLLASPQQQLHFGTTGSWLSSLTAGETTEDESLLGPLPPYPQLTRARFSLSFILVVALLTILGCVVTIGCGSFITVLGAAAIGTIITVGGMVVCGSIVLVLMAGWSLLVLMAAVATAFMLMRGL